MTTTLATAAEPGQAAGRRWAACAAVALAVALFLAGGLTEGISEAAFQLAIVAYAVVGALIVWHRPDHRVGWLMVAVAMLILGSTALDAYARGELRNGTPAPAVWARWAQGWLFSLVFGLGSTLLLLVLPDGRLPSPRWRPLAHVMVATIVLATLVPALAPGPIGEDAPVDNPAGIQGLGELLDGLGVVLEVALGACFLAAVAALVVRWRNATEQERRQLAWILQGVLMSVALLGVAAALSAWDAPEPVAGSVVGPAMATPALGVAVAVLRERLLDIEVVVSRTLVYAGFSAALLGTYAAALALSSLWFSTQTDVAASLLATAVLAALLGSVRERLQRGFERVLFGRRSEPYDVLRGLGAIAERHADRSALVAELVKETRRALRLPYVAVSGPGQPGTASGRRPERVASFRLSYAGRQLGVLEAGLRPGQSGFGPSEAALLESAAARVATSVWAHQLDSDLASARERLVRSREQERIRIRRDLHDGVGPVLAAATLQLDSLRRRLPDDDHEGQDLAERVKGELQQLVLDIRDLLEDLRPPNLDAGLARALESQAAALVDGGIEVDLDVGELPPLDPAVEVAAYRIASEAMTNVVRHSSAATCRVRVAVDAGVLVVDVADDGHGLPDGHGRGVGLDSMAERAAELGGSLEVASVAHGGVRVTARLPLEAA